MRRFSSRDQEALLEVIEVYHYNTEVEDMEDDDSCLPGSEKIVEGTVN